MLQIASLFRKFPRIFILKCLVMFVLSFDSFKINTNDVDDHEYMKVSILGGRQYVMKEPLTSLPKARIQLRL